MHNRMYSQVPCGEAYYDKYCNNISVDVLLQCVSFNSKKNKLFTWHSAGQNNETVLIVSLLPSFCSDQLSSQNDCPNPLPACTLFSSPSSIDLCVLILSLYEVKPCYCMARTRSRQIREAGAIERVSFGPQRRPRRWWVTGKIIYWSNRTYKCIMFCYHSSRQPYTRHNTRRCGKLHRIQFMSSALYQVASGVLELYRH